MGLTLRATMLNRMKAHAATWLTDTCTIQRVTRSQELMSPSEIWNPVATDVACRVIEPKANPSTTALEIVASQQSMRDMYRVVFASGVDIRQDDRIIVEETTYSVMHLRTELTDEFFHTAVVQVQRGVESA